MAQIDIKKHFPHNTYRPYQEEILDTIEKYYEDYDFFLVEAPTGVGKSPIAEAFSEAHETCDVLTYQIRLQQQYAQKYKFKTVTGRGNHLCLQCDNFCSNGVCIQEKKFMCEFRPIAMEEPDENYHAGTSANRGDLYWTNNNTHCPYWAQKMEALKFGKVVHNYSYYLYESNYVGDFGSPDAIVADECHRIESAVMSFVHTTITDEQMERIGVQLPNFPEPEQWIAWLKALSGIYIPRRLEELESDLEQDSKNTKTIREIKELETIIHKIKFFLEHQEKNPQDWLMLPYQNRSNTLSKIEFKPLVVNEFVKNLIFKDSKKHLIMSGTILDFKTFRRSLGLDTEKCLEIKVPSPFPVESRLIYNADIGNLNASALNPKNPDNSLRDLILFIDEVLDSPHFRHTKGIIHTTSYTLAEYIVNNCATGPRMLTHTESGGAQEILEIHKSTSEPTILVSPSMTDGVDLYDDLSRIQIPVHVPYLNSLDPVIATRREQDMAWYNMLTGVNLIQSMGRSNRHMKDWSTTIIPDSRVHNFFYKQLGVKNTPEYILGSKDVEGSFRTREQLIEKFNFNLEFE